MGASRSLGTLVDERGEDQRSFFSPDRLSAVATWTGTGFALLTSLLTFFGIKDGVLQRLLREEPAPALWVFLLVGAGVVLGLLATAVSPTWQLPSAVLLLAVAALAVPTVLLLPDLPEEETSRLPTLLTATVAAAWLLALLLFARTRIALVAGMLLCAVAALSLGLYGGTKLSVLATLADDRPRATAGLVRGEDGEQVTVSVTASRQDDARLQVQVLGRPHGGTDDEQVPIGRAVVPADTAGAVDAALTFPVTTSAWQGIAVRVCPAPSDGPGSGDACSAEDEVATLSVGRGRAAEDAVAGWFAGTAESPATQVQATVRGTALPGTVLAAEVHRVATDGQETLVSLATLAADGTGAVSWDSGPLTGEPGQRLELRTAGQGGEGRSTVATYVF